MLKYDSISELVAEAEKRGVKISDIVIEEQAEACETTKEALYKKMYKSFRIMQTSIDDGLEEDTRSVSGLTGGSAWKMKKQVDEGKNICGHLFGTAMSMALAVSETNACMGKIVAAPTAGSCGIIPAVVVSVMNEKKIPVRDVVMGLFAASGIGLVIAHKASIAGAEGGCQAECGVAAAMAAAAVVYLAGGTCRQQAAAVSLALINVMGLVCDPIAGLVQIPCAQRNASQAVNAIVSADLALADTVCPVPADEAIEAMYRVGKQLPRELRETALGGIAESETGKRIADEIRNQ